VAAFEAGLGDASAVLVYASSVELHGPNRWAMCDSSSVRVFGRRDDRMIRSPWGSNSLISPTRSPPPSSPHPSNLATDSTL
jgi:hypothetical protein